MQQRDGKRRNKNQKREGAAWEREHARVCVGEREREEEEEGERRKESEVVTRECVVCFHICQEKLKLVPRGKRERGEVRRTKDEEEEGQLRT